MKTHTMSALICLSLLAPSLFGQTNTSANKPNVVTTPLAIPEEARKHFVMGTTLFADAKSPADFVQVESEFKQAADLAPQWPDARYNLALTKEAAGDYSGAMVDLKLYQQFKLSDADARKVQDKIYVLEAKAGAAARKQAEIQKAAVAEEQKKQNYENNIGFLVGKWRLLITYFGIPRQPMERDAVIAITISGNNVFIVEHDNDGSDHQLLKGTIEGDDFASIKWVRQVDPAWIFPGAKDLPDCPIDVTVDKPSHQIRWKQPRPYPPAWDWSVGEYMQLTQ